jgi:hypothetical protein
MSHENLEDMIQLLETRSTKNFGKITCCVFSDLCYISNKHYPTCSGIKHRIIYGTYSHGPYNLLQYHEENGWMIPCLQQHYLMRNSVIPHFGSVHNLPEIFKITRSDGSIQDVFLCKEDYGISVRKSKTLKDTQDRFYVRVHFSSDQKVLDTKTVEDIRFNSDLCYKDIALEDIVALNSNIQEAGIHFNFNTLEIKGDMTPLQKGLVTYCNEEMQSWINNKVKPAMDNLNKRVKINLVLTLDNI